MTDDNFSDEQAIRKKIEKRIKARNEAQSNLFVHILFFLGVNIWLFGLGGWVQALLNGYIHLPNLITTVWGFFILMHILEYSHDHGYGYARRQRQIDQEYERLIRLRSPKRKNDDLFSANHNALVDDHEIYLDEDGEITFTKK